ncbi:MAG: serine/threonine protein phosphatase [Acidobacteria bacterium]|nr:MAG: serine/threonine protein phosphatase [Acidobacteriota bacterium]
MASPFSYLRLRLETWGLLPKSRVARAVWFVLGLDLLLFLFQRALRLFHSSYGQSLAGWIIFLSIVVIALLTVLAYRWLKIRLLWRLRNRLIVTYIFIGVIPAILLIAMYFISTYLFAGQFANFVVTSELQTQLRGMEGVNTAVAGELAQRASTRQALSAESLQGLRTVDFSPATQVTCVWVNDKPLVLEGCAKPPFSVSTSLQPRFSGIVSDNGDLFLRTAIKVPAGTQSMTVISSQPIFVAGKVPRAASLFDWSTTFPTLLSVVNWKDGRQIRASALQVETRPSVLYARLFASFGEFVAVIEFALIAIAVAFAIIELLAIYIGTRLTRTVTFAIAQLYEATKHINQGDFSHRIAIRSTDQVATLASSFNSMTASIQNLIEEQKEKQRLQNELTIAHEVQSQLFPRQISELASLEVHGFCRPARTVSGDYYDFVTLDSNRMIVAVGDVSGKGISAAILMATINSAVRAYSLEGIPLIREAALAAGGGHGSSIVEGVETSPGSLLGLLNHQLFASTPAEKYATMFLGIYDGKHRRLTYSNAGHLPPILLSPDGSIRRLEQGGTVVGLFDGVSYEDCDVQLSSDDIFLAYSDGVTEPENDFGEFGDERLIELVRENRALPLARISELVTEAVTDWIGDREQPDDVTLVLARVR